jgi:CRP-like cAMP-binding protein
MRRANERARADYNRILGGSVADAIKVEAEAPAGMPGSLIDPASDDGGRITRLAALLRGFSTADIAEALDLAGQLGGRPAERAHWLERLGEAVGRFAGFEPLAFACIANAAATFAAIGDPEGERRCAATMLGYERDEAWMGYARKMIARHDARPGENLTAIAECGPYAGLSEATRGELAKIAGVPHRYPKGDYLCLEGLRADKAFFVKHGRVAILQEVDHTEKFLRFRHPGEVVGEMALIAGQRRRTASCLAVEATEAWVVSYDRLEALRSDPKHADLRQLLDRQFVERRVETRLLQHPLTARLDLADRVRLADMVDTGPGAPMRVAANQTLATRAAAVDHVYLLLDGTVDLARTAGDGPDATFTTTDKRAFFLGLPALFGSVSWPSDLIAKKDGWVARIPVEALRSFAASRPGLREAVAEVLITSPTGRALSA